jgi:hypothetical protein
MHKSLTKRSHTDLDKYSIQRNIIFSSTSENNRNIKELTIKDWG